MERLLSSYNKKDYETQKKEIYGLYWKLEEWKYDLTHPVPILSNIDEV